MVGMRDAECKILEELRLTLEDGKTILNGIEQDIIQTQVDIQSGLCRACVNCQEPQRVKDAEASARHRVWARHGAMAAARKMAVAAQTEAERGHGAGVIAARR
jgi:hypothetical protein